MMKHELGDALCNSDNHLKIEGRVGDNSISIEASGLIAWGTLLTVAVLTAWALSPASNIDFPGLPYRECNFEDTDYSNI